MVALFGIAENLKMTERFRFMNDSNTSIKCPYSKICSFACLNDNQKIVLLQTTHAEGFPRAGLRWESK